MRRLRKPRRLRELLAPPVMEIGRERRDERRLAASAALSAETAQQPAELFAEPAARSLRLRRAAVAHQLRGKARDALKLRGVV